MEAVTLFELQSSLKEGLADLFPERIRVRAELASVQVKAGGHCYIELSQSDSRGVIAKARAVIWRSIYPQIAGAFRQATGSDLKPGISILALCQVNYSELYGLSLIISDIEPELTLGEAELRKRATIARLEKEGLMDAQSQLALPALPRNLAVISARDAAGYGDFCRHLETNEWGFSFSLTLYEALMQGESAPESVAAAISRIEDECAEGLAGPYDAILIMRGGGSVLDLACFDEWLMCAAIARCCIPVMTAIGHDRDVHVADMVACVSVKTPTALADALIDAFALEDERLSQFGTRLRMAFNNRLAEMERSVDRLQHRVLQAFAGKLLLQESYLDRMAERLRAADPRSVLARGYALVSDASGIVRASAAGFSQGDALDVTFPDGKVQCIVKNVDYGK